MNPVGIKDDPIRQATQACPYRREIQSESLFGRGTDHLCTHPAVSTKDEVGGGVDDFSTFCVPVDMHLRSLGESSKLVIEVEYRLLDQK